MTKETKSILHSYNSHARYAFVIDKTVYILDHNSTFTGKKILEIELINNTIRWFYPLRKDIMDNLGVDSQEAKKVLESTLKRYNIDNIYEVLKTVTNRNDSYI